MNGRNATGQIQYQLEKHDIAAMETQRDEEKREKDSARNGNEDHLRESSNRKPSAAN